ncbi:unnamed protein product [Brachionus calyciflorus]|uniref:BTB domain-containing protein n=1 Tax=Brachionus calyciflorus TaxID=104777 RepID=A0A813RXC6_9BILA|nr:unnamed protein product [Brachionus calyciflorus]
MDCIGYRISGELSDITVVVDNEEFHLHKFPLFVRSNYFKNLTSLQNDSSKNKSRVVLENFPGGSRTFEIIADYCYNKDVDVNLNNVVSVKCAAEYLEMTGGTGRGGLVMLADNILFDLTYSAKTKRDFYLPLVLLDKSVQFKKYSENSGLTQKLIDSVVENLHSFLKSAAVYDNIEKDPKKTKKNRISLSEDSLKILNNLPLDWMNDLIRSAARVGLSQPTLSVIIENYIDFNTGLNPHYESKTQDRTQNLVSITASILKVDQKLSQINQQEKELDDNSNLKSIAADLLSKEEPRNLINIAGEILEPKSNNLISITADILNNEKPSNLISIASDILEEEPTPATDQILSSEEPKNLINIASDILDTPNRTINLVTIAGDILKESNLNNNDKLRIIDEITRNLTELRLEPEFSISWLLIYINVLHELNADNSTRSAFNSWAWNAINDLKSDSRQLSSVPVSVMTELSKDISKRDSTNSSKLIDLVDRYIYELNNENRLSPDQFIQLAGSIPKEKRNSFDELTRIVLDMLRKETHNLDSDKRQQLFDLIDFDKLNEKTLQECDECEFIPQKYITKAALNLCAKLRRELDEIKLLNKSYEPTSKTTKPLSTKIDIEPVYSPSTKFTSPRFSATTTNRNQEKILNDEKKITNTQSSKTAYSSLYSPLSTAYPSYHYTYPKYGNSSPNLKTKSSIKDIKDNYSTKTTSKNSYSKSTYQSYQHHRNHHDCLDYDVYDYFDYLDDGDTTTNSYMLGYNRYRRFN